MEPMTNGVSETDMGSLREPARFVYVAGPYTCGDVAENVKRAIDAADRLWRAGYRPYCPHLSHFHHLVHPHAYEEWLEFDMDWLEVCDAVLRLEGESGGADGEVRRARELGMPVYYGEGGILQLVADGGMCENAQRTRRRRARRVANSGSSFGSEA